MGVNGPTAVGEGISDCVAFGIGWGRGGMVVVNKLTGRPDTGQQKEEKDYSPERLLCFRHLYSSKAKDVSAAGAGEGLDLTGGACQSTGMYDDR